MTVKKINKGTGEFHMFQNLFRTHLGVSYKETEQAPEKTLLFGRYDQNEMIAFALFHPYKEPGLHIGSMIDPEQFNRLAYDNTVIYVIRLIYAFKGNHILKESAEALIASCEHYLLSTYGEYCLMISLYENANQKAFPLYSGLGFKKKADTESYAMAIDLSVFLRKHPDAIALQETFSFKSFNHLTAENYSSFIDCYRETFTPELPGEFVEAQLRGLLTGGMLLGDVSVIIMDKMTNGKVIGFCLIAKETKKGIHILAFGMAKSSRKGFAAAGLFYPIMKNCYDKGYQTATFSTASKRLKKAFERVLAAHLLDTVCWHIKCNVSDA